MIAVRAKPGQHCDFCDRLSSGLTVSMNRILACPKCVEALHTAVKSMSTDVPLSLHGDVRAASPETLFRPGGRTMADVAAARRA